MDPKLPLISENLGLRGILQHVCLIYAAPHENLAKPMPKHLSGMVKVSTHASELIGLCKGYHFDDSLTQINNFQIKPNVH